MIENTKMNKWAMDRVLEILIHSVLNRLSSSNPFFQGSGIYVEEMTERLKSQMPRITSAKQCFPRTIGLILIWTHWDWGIMHKTCNVQARQNPIMENQKWAQSSMSHQGGFCTWYLVGEVKSVSLSTDEESSKKPKKWFHLHPVLWIDKFPIANYKSMSN